MARSLFPWFACGRVVRGFGRGSKQLSCPTANLSDSVVSCLPPELRPGVYFGWANVDDGPVYGSVVSIGWNPHFENKKKTMEAHLLHTFQDDFYGSKLKLIILGFIREMAKYDGLDALKAAIQKDINVAQSELAKPSFAESRRCQFFAVSGETKFPFVGSSVSIQEDKPKSGL